MGRRGAVRIKLNHPSTTRVRGHHPLPLQRNTAFHKLETLCFREVSLFGLGFCLPLVNYECYSVDNGVVPRFRHADVFCLFLSQAFCYRRELPRDSALF